MSADIVERRQEWWSMDTVQRAAYVDDLIAHIEELEAEPCGTEFPENDDLLGCNIRVWTCHLPAGHDGDHQAVIGIIEWEDEEAP